VGNSYLQDSESDPQTALRPPGHRIEPGGYPEAIRFVWLSMLHSFTNREGPESGQPDPILGSMTFRHQGPDLILGSMTFWDYLPYLILGGTTFWGTMQKRRLNGNNAGTKTQGEE